MALEIHPQAIPALLRIVDDFRRDGHRLSAQPQSARAAFAQVPPPGARAVADDGEFLSAVRYVDRGRYSPSGLAAVNGDDGETLSEQRMKRRKNKCLNQCVADCRWDGLAPEYYFFRNCSGSLFRLNNLSKTSPAL